MNRHKEICKELYCFYRERGFCISCGVNYCEPGHVTCKQCAKKRSITQKNTDPDGSKARARVQALRDERRDKGLCVNCGNKTDGIHRRCEKCLKKAQEYKQLRRIKKRVQKGLI